MQGDAKRLMQAFHNVLDNAIRYSPPNTEVAVNVKTVGGELLISVSDHGIDMGGGEAHVASKVFRQADWGISKRTNGLDLTLSLIFFELHGGTLNITGPTGEGTTADILIPVENNQK
ncbi:MAG TPA: ATP-binding protein [bacterium]|nr:ATP-binding protein [bacterium]